MLSGVGLAGVVSVCPTALERLRNAPLPPGTSLPALAAASLITPTMLLAVAVVAGPKTATRLGLQSSLLDRAVHDAPILPRLRGDVATAVRRGAVVGNAAGGVVFGRLFWRRSLEAAMLSHATVHVVLVVASIAALVVA